MTSRTPLRDQHARRPVNRTAALVTSSVGEEPAWKRAEGSRDSDLPIPTMGRPFEVCDMVGRRVGRFIVVGYHSNNPKKNAGHRWVVRCACGTYSVRGQKALESPANCADACDRCRHVRHMKNGDTAEVSRELVVRPLPANQPQMEDLTGIVCGQITVLGYFGNSGTGAAWVVECTCGVREIRKTKTIRMWSPEVPESCQRCKRKFTPDTQKSKIIFR